MLLLTTPLSRISGIGPRFLAKFKRLQIYSVRDLLYHFPFRYEDYSEIYKITDLEPGQQATVQGIIESSEIHRSWRKHIAVVSATIKDDTGSVRATWFNQPYIKNILIPGTLWNFSGKVSSGDGEIYLAHPTFERIRNSDASETRHTARLVPIYSETSGLTSKGIRYIIQPLLHGIGYPEDWMPEEILREYNLPDFSKAMKNIHFPDSLADAEQARFRFAFENLFLLQFVNAKEKSKLADKKAHAISIDMEKIKGIVGRLPFTLTFSQKKSLWEILKEVMSPRPMNRLLQGDVGSGKTVIAAITAFAVSLVRKQTALMAPTEVLAIQHYETLKKIFGSLPPEEAPSIAMLTGSGAKVWYGEEMETTKTKKEAQNLIFNGKADVIVGTHSLISSSGAGKSAKTFVKFNSLALVVVDEQHRFGVSQRAMLSKHSGNNNELPHFLSMSATPIPRTLMLTLFGDLNISTITELPKGRKPISTKVIPDGERKSVYEFTRKELKSGRQAFVICPRITASENDIVNSTYDNISAETVSVEQVYERLSKNIFKEFNVRALHGQMKPKEKNLIMEDFRSGKIQMLVSTSVVEVGVDIPNATIMMIEGAERFGLAQLYQFRGRIGRGEHSSYCFLFPESNMTEENRRLKAILEAKNGFELAEKDLAIRGPGEFLGENQTGMPDSLMRGLQNIESIKISRMAANQILSKDSTLKNYPLLRIKIRELAEKLHLE